MRDTLLAGVVEPVLAAHGLELDDLSVTSLGRRKLVRITVDGDGPQGRGPLLDDISAASAEIGAALDASDVTGNTPYTLEVSSRGVSKPLTQPKHYRRNTGRLVKLTRAEDQLTGRITGATDDVVTVEVAGEAVEVPLADITKAVVQVEMNRPGPVWEPEAEDEEN